MEVQCSFYCAYIFCRSLFFAEGKREVFVLAKIDAPLPSGGAARRLHAGYTSEFLVRQVRGGEKECLLDSQSKEKGAGTCDQCHR